MATFTVRPEGIIRQPALTMPGNATGSEAACTSLTASQIRTLLSLGTTSDVTFDIVRATTSVQTPLVNNASAALTLGNATYGVTVPGNATIGSGTAYTNLNVYGSGVANKAQVIIVDTETAISTAGNGCGITCFGSDIGAGNTGKIFYLAKDGGGSNDVILRNYIDTNIIFAGSLSSRLQLGSTTASFSTKVQLGDATPRDLIFGDNTGTKIARSSSTQSIGIYWQNVQYLATATAGACASGGTGGAVVGGGDYGSFFLASGGFASTLHIGPGVAGNSSINGASVYVAGGTASTVGNYNGGHVHLDGGAKNGTGTNGLLKIGSVRTTNVEITGTTSFDSYLYGWGGTTNGVRLELGWNGVSYPSFFFGAPATGVSRYFGYAATNASMCLIKTTAFGWVNSTSDCSSAAPDTKFVWNAVGQLDIRGDAGFRVRNLANTDDAALTCAGITASGVVSHGAYTVATLPAAGSNAGKMAQVTDSNVAASGNYGATVAAGGANRVKVFSDGTNWVIA